MKTILVVLLIIIAIIFLVAKIGVNRRKRRLATWASTVTLYKEEAEMLSSLWLAMKKGLDNGLITSYLSGKTLSVQSRRFLLQVCSAAYRPEMFGKNSALRLASFMEYMEMGFNEYDSAILVGMTYNFIGRSDLYKVEIIEEAEAFRITHERFAAMIHVDESLLID